LLPVEESGVPSTHNSTLSLIFAYLRVTTLAARDARALEPAHDPLIRQAHDADYFLVRELPGQGRVDSPI
jgi:hypothetical protein